jgi:hypothetical protein
MSHKCAKPECKLMVSDQMFACRPHWLMLPKHYRDRIWGSWDSRDFSSLRYWQGEAIGWYFEYERTHQDVTSGG